MAENTSKNAIVTGASSGIGAATVRQLRTDDWNVIAVARREDRLAHLAQDTGAIAFAADITADDDVARLHAFTADTFAQLGGLDTLINIAGGARGVDTVANAGLEDWEWMYQVNVLGTVKVLKAFLPDLRAHGFGTVLNLTSTAAHITYEGGAGYSAAKFGQHALTNALRLEEAENNLRVIEVAPEWWPRRSSPSTVSVAIRTRLTRFIKEWRSHSRRRMWQAWWVTPSGFPITSIWTRSCSAP